MKPPKSILIAASLLTIGVVVILTRSQRSTIEYQGHHIPLEQLRIVDPHPGCEHTHYHAVASKSANATDGTLLADESDCGYGPVK